MAVEETIVFSSNERKGSFPGFPFGGLVPRNAVVIQRGETNEQESRERNRRAPMRRKRPITAGAQRPLLTGRRRICGSPRPPAPAG